MSQLTDQVFEILRKHIHRICGIYLQKEKKYLVEQRLEAVVKSQSCQNFSELALKMTHKISPKFEEEIITAITTNETSFFRDKHPFETFRDHLLPVFVQLVKKRKLMNQRRGPRVNIWSAASSTGQEPYCLAMDIHKYITTPPTKGVVLGDFRILATDISSEVLSQAMSGKYNALEISRGISEEQKNRYFHAYGKSWGISEEIKGMVEFRKVNLMVPFAFLGSYDLILCRNVLIYFDEESSRRIISQFYRMMSNDSVLMLGSSENLPFQAKEFERLEFNNTRYYKKSKPDT